MNGFLELKPGGEDIEVNNSNRYGMTRRRMSDSHSLGRLGLPFVDHAQKVSSHAPYVTNCSKEYVQLMFDHYMTKSSDQLGQFLLVCVRICLFFARVLLLGVTCASE